ncbi:MAG: hypothetical protein H6652_21495 [Ardenticatenaceae bacterium]|nr:hypothetical protein [Ardenticatenaceae bacterium]
MSTVLSSKVAYAGIGFLLTLISGVVLSKMGRPLNSAVFGAHKIIAVGTIVLIGLNIRDLAQVVGLQAVHPALIWGTGLLLLALVVSGSLLSFDKLVLPLTLRVHQIVPLLALAFSALSIYLLANGRS